MAWATYLTASPHTLDGYFRTESQADDRITAAAAKSPPVTLSKTGSISYKIPSEASLRWVFDSASNDFVPPSMGDAALRRIWKERLAGAAKMVDNSVHQHWAYLSRANAAFETTPSASAAQRVDNTFDWARSWIGLAWLEILKFERDTDATALVMRNSVTAALSDMDAVQNVVDKALAELPNPDHIYFWYRAHSTPAIWRAYLDARQMWSTNADGTGALFESDRYNGLPSATWEAMLVTYYQAARDWAAGIGVS